MCVCYPCYLVCPLSCLLDTLCITCTDFRRFCSSYALCIPGPLLELTFGPASTWSHWLTVKPHVTMTGKLGFTIA